MFEDSEPEVGHALDVGGVDCVGTLGVSPRRLLLLVRLSLLVRHPVALTERGDVTQMGQLLRHNSI